MNYFNYYLIATCLLIFSAQSMENSYGDCACCFRVLNANQNNFDQIEIQCKKNSFHTFHTQCLEKFKKTCKQEGRYFECPSCKVLMSKTAQMKITIFNQMRQKDNQFKNAKIIRAINECEREVFAVDNVFNTSLKAYSERNELLSETIDEWCRGYYVSEQNCSTLTAAVGEWKVKYLEAKENCDELSNWYNYLLVKNSDLKKLLNANSKKELEESKREYDKLKKVLKEKEDIIKEYEEKENNRWKKKVGREMSKALRNLKMNLYISD